MTRILLSAVALMAMAASTAFAQDGPAAPDVPAAADTSPTTSNGGAGIRDGNISATGRTMPGVGASKGAGTTSLDKGIQAKDNEITSGICKGC